MTTTTIDARGLPCPQPVILTRNAMREAQELTVLVTGRDQVTNVSRLAEKAGWQTQLEQRPDGYAIHLVKGQEPVAEPELTTDLTSCDISRRTVVVAASDQMGRGDDELGAILVRAFFHTLTESNSLPGTIIFYNTGVKLAAEGSPILDDLRDLQGKGVEILACGTCLGYFNLKERLAVGTISNMYTISETLLGAAHIVTL